MKTKDVPQRTLIKELKSGGIYTEIGADGVYLQFDCDCIDALPYCKAACCNLREITVSREEEINLPELVVLNTENDNYEMKRSATGWCRCNDPNSKLCTIYDDRPQTCRDFHCTRGHEMRGWKLDLVRIE